MYQQYFDDYCERLFSYNFLNWPYRDSKLKPSKMASIGYICHEDSLQCFYCQKKIMIDDQILPSDVILERAINQHDQYCQAMAIKFKITQEFLHSYGMAYYDECLASWKDPIELKKTYLDKVPQNLNFLVQNPKQVLAIFGWIKQDQILLCKFCGRKCQIVEEEFDVFQEHRYFCKWANEGRNIKYGYLIVLQQLRDQSTQNTQDAKERENNNVEQDVLRKTLVSQCENIISVNLLTNTELQKAKAQILACQDQLTKRKRFDVKESEREMEEFELDIQKKVKVQKEQIEERNKERMSMINKQDSDEEEEQEQEVDMAVHDQQAQHNHVQENKENTNNQQQHNQVVNGADQRIEQEDNQKQETNREQKENSENQNQVQEIQEIQKREKLITNHIQEEQIQQQQMIVQNQEEQIEQQIIAQSNKSKQSSPQLPTQLLVEQRGDQYSSERGEQINQVVPQDKEIEKVQVQQSEEIIEKQEKGENNLININNVEQQHNQNNDSQKHNNQQTIQDENQQDAEEKEQNQQLVQDQVEHNEKSIVIEQNQQAQIQSQEIEIEQEKKEPNPNVEVQEVNKDNEQIQDQEIKEVEIQNIVISDEKNQNQIISEQQKVDTIERELESKQQNQEENIQQEVEVDQEKNLESPKNIMKTSFQNDDSNLRNQEDNKIMTIINLEDQIKSRQQENQEIEQEQEEQDNPNVIEAQDNENLDKD
ncbi:unnamed protein product (macronuclear) [Paramecium tetraurelia]|uniref:C3HC-type domain-containing protein n=1 Tax=Paramecium tetraurelia TaxID=5888 RepID=A0CYG7_PARTE|nr:uncharacterized protein GSPATT00011434001 [Paramecium tetraurelia]CAK75834.1 unnamed protein product [Paramecium tetraurelia]|eukprot:XP_001443231.1 hypothetical protein (macronuclear) [Paramecium tetraurelia strain d4-2]